MTQQIQDLRYVVKHYPIMQGLTLAIMGFYYAFTGALNMIWTWWIYPALFSADTGSWLANVTPLLVTFLPIILFILAFFAIYRYYTRRFGTVKARPEDQKLLYGEIAAGLLVFFLVAMPIDIHFRSSLSIMGMVFAVFLLAHWFLLARRQVHYLILAILAALLSCLPFLSTPIYHFVYLHGIEWYSQIIGIVGGSFLVLAGLLDHIQLVRTLSQVRNTIVDDPGVSEQKA